jgi:hypothetical protein
VADIPGIERIRYTTSHPNEFTPRLIEAYAKLPKLASHLHLPVQHGSDRILMAMKRGYTAMEYKSTVRKLRAIRPDLAMSSDFIVGFPGETEDDFNKMMKLIDDIHFDNSFSFIFSPRPGTPAANLHDDTPHDVKLRRLQQLQAVINANIKSISESRVGTVQRILVEGHSRLLSLQNSLAHHPQVGQGKHHQQLAGVLGQTFVAHLAMAKLALDDSKRVLDLGADARLDGFKLIDQRIERLALVQCLALARHHGNVPATVGVQFLHFVSLFNPPIARVGKDDVFLTVQQRVRLRDVMGIGCGGGDGVHQPRVGVHANVEAS